MFLHTHPYPPYIPERATRLIVGTLPPPRFTTGVLRERDVDFCYGSQDGQLWPILDRIFDLGLVYETTNRARQQRIDFLEKRGIGICDIVASAKRDKIDASDLGMQEVLLRDLVAILESHPNITTLLFTGGNSKNGPEYFFRRLLKRYELRLEVISDIVPRIHEFSLPKSGRRVQTVSLIAPSGAANRAVGSLQQYKDMKNKNPEMNTIDFRVLHYRNFF
ncbi:MAG: uracil-DNA glycosylase family protein [Bacteroidota bacterium]